jgi:dTDP-4-dehydrorhamnose 3,5-epimerase-like enzyme
METVRAIKFNAHEDNRGKLISLEEAMNVPFRIKRVFFIYDIPPLTERGGHAHKTCHQLFLAIKGSCNIELNGRHRSLYHLYNPKTGLYVPPGIQVKMSGFSMVCVLMVLASEPYDPNDYIQ